MASRSAPFRRIGPATGKPRFAKRAFAFAKRAPGFPILWIANSAAAALMIVTGGFGTAALPLGQRILFWLALMGWTALKWQCWFIATVRTHADWTRASLLGALVLCLPLPFEIYLAGRAAGVSAAVPGLFPVWGSALAIGAVIYVTGIFVLRAMGLRTAKTPPATPAANGILDRAHVAPEMLAAIEAEDHYCRVRRRDGSDALIHYRFGDAMNEIADIDGAQVHRGVWVASSAVTGAVREGRRWRLILAGDTRVPVSATYLPKIRALGWLKGINRGSTGV